MHHSPSIDVLIPAYNEEESLAFVLANLPKNLVRQIIVCNNGSTDQTVAVAHSKGALVVHQPERGYGNACLKGIDYLKNMPINDQPDIVVFIDADYSDFPEELSLLIKPIIEDGVQLVIGSRRLGIMEAGAMTFPQRFGNWLAPALIQIVWGVKFTDLGPFRAVTWSALLAMQMADTNFGWTVEMQAKAAKLKFKSIEIPVSYRKRAGGKSKVSGTIMGAWRAGWKILYTIGKIAIQKNR